MQPMELGEKVQCSIACNKNAQDEIVCLKHCPFAPMCTITLVACCQSIVQDGKLQHNLQLLNR